MFEKSESLWIVKALLPYFPLGLFFQMDPSGVELASYGNIIVSCVDSSERTGPMKLLLRDLAQMLRLRRVVSSNKNWWSSWLEFDALKLNITLCGPILFFSTGRLGEPSQQPSGLLCTSVYTVMDVQFNVESEPRGRMNHKYSHIVWSW